MHYYAIIVAGGIGSRMNSGVPKQFLPVAGVPVLMHTIRAFYGSDYHPHIIVVMHPGFHEYWKELCSRLDFNVTATLVDGGETRYDSVKNALSVIKENSIIAVHDAVRPMVSNETISGAYRLAAETGSAVTAIPSRDSVRRSLDNGKTSAAMQRDEIYLVQTPQVFRSEILAAAYSAGHRPEFTDDASVVEAAGYPIHIVPGETQNIKITYPEDLQIASLFLGQKKSGRSGQIE